MALTQAQLAARDGKLTASRVACLMTGDAERIYALWLEMVGDPSFEPEDLSDVWPVQLGSVTEEHWHDLLGSNLKAPLFLSQAMLPALRSAKGVIINIVDVHAQRPLREHPVYGAAKAGLAMLTRSLAKDLGPHVRVNGVSPGAILWPDEGMSDPLRAAIIKQTALKRSGEPEDIARTVLFLVRDAPYITGQIIAVDGGRSVGW